MITILRNVYRGYFLWLKDLILRWR